MGSGLTGCIEGYVGEGILGFPRGIQGFPDGNEAIGCAGPDQPRTKAHNAKHAALINTDLR